MPSIRQLIEGKPARERATIKGREIAKLGPQPRQNVKFSGADFDIEIVSMNPIEGGVEVFARAWDENGQIGFGKDGTVDIERFLIYDPMITAPSGTKKLIKNDQGEDKLRDIWEENLEGSIRLQLASIIRAKQQKFGPENIVQGSVGSTTSTFNSAIGANSPADGGVGEQDTAVDWSTLVAAAGTDGGATGQTFAADSGELGAVAMRSSSTTDKWDDLARGILMFDTSPIGSDQVDSATLTAYTWELDDNLSITPDIAVYDSAPAANDDVVAGDFNSFGTTALSTVIAYGDHAAVGNEQDHVLNAAGLAAINTGGITKLGFRNANYDVADSAPTWASASFSRFNYLARDNDGANGTIPKLVVEHSAASTFTPTQYGIA